MGGSMHLEGASGVLSASFLGTPVCIWLFCGLVVLSRIAFWTFDMVDTQILQTVTAAFISFRPAPILLAACAHHQSVALLPKKFALQWGCLGSTGIWRSIPIGTSVRVFTFAFGRPQMVISSASSIGGSLL